MAVINTKSPQKYWKQSLSVHTVHLLMFCLIACAFWSCRVLSPQGHCTHQHLDRPHWRADVCTRAEQQLDAAVVKTPAGAVGVLGPMPAGAQLKIEFVSQEHSVWFMISKVSKVLSDVQWASAVTYYTSPDAVMWKCSLDYGGQQRQMRCYGPLGETCCSLIKKKKKNTKQIQQQKLGENKKNAAECQNKYINSKHTATTETTQEPPKTKFSRPTRQSAK